MATDRQLALAMGLVTQAYLLGDTARGMQATMIINCGTVRLKILSEKTVDRVISKMQDRVDNLRNLQQLRERGL